MNKVKQEKIFSESNAIEKEMDSLTADDMRHIIVTTTDTIQNRHILDYIDIISAQDVKFQIEHIDPAQTENQRTLSSETFRSSVMLTLERLRKQAYLVGADAVVGVSI
jgi:uncharacterized protein YbjQ (UPF0145 family)